MNLFSLLNRIGLSKTKALPAKSPWQLKPNLRPGAIHKILSKLCSEKDRP